MRVESIELREALPEVFAAAESDAGDSVAGSGVWLRNIAFRRGERVLVNAGSGRGKSSLLSYIYGRRTDYMGSILIGGREARSLSIAEWSGLRRKNLSLLPQELSLFGELTAIENVMIKNRLTGCRSTVWIEEAFTLLGVEGRMECPAAKLSVGQQQRVAVIRALCQPFDFLLLDEPVSHLDSDNNDAVARLVSEALRETGAGVIVTSVGNPLNLDYDREIEL